MAKRPNMKRLPSLAHGEGSWGYDPDRQKITLRHRWNGKPHIERGETPGECTVRRDRRRRDSDVRATLAGDGTLGGLLAEWFEFEREGRKPSTIRGYEGSIRKLHKHLGADTLVVDLTVASTEIMYATEVRDGLGKAALEKLRSHWSMAMAFGVRRNLLPAPVREQLRMSEQPPTPMPKSKRWYTLANYELVREHFLRNRQTRNTMFMTMLLCGLRPGEARGLKWEFVDVDARYVHVEGTIERYGPNGDVYTTVLKTDHVHPFAHRKVPIPADLALVLAEMQRDASNEFVFIEDGGKARGRLMTFNAVALHAKNLALDLRVPYVNPNGYRHTFASVCRHYGMPYEQLAKLMGHQDATQIIRTYGHPIKDVVPVDLDRYLGSPETIA